MKRFALFTGDKFYPSGGWGDFKGTFDSTEDSIANAFTHGGDWYQVVDLQSGQIVKQGTNHLYK